MTYKYFSSKELACSCGNCETQMDSEFMADLVQLREHCAFPFVITSAFRCDEHNTKVGGYPSSYHLQGRAVDIQVFGDKAHKILSLARRYGMMGIGVSQKGDFSTRFLHLDNRPTGSLWSY